VKHIQVGRDGLIVKKDDKEGLLLPQVAPEHGWDRLALLENTCLKAGLPTSTWKDPGADLFSFTALIFGGGPAPSSRR